MYTRRFFKLARRLGVGSGKNISTSTCLNSEKAICNAIKAPPYYVEARPEKCCTKDELKTKNIFLIDLRRESEIRDKINAKTYVNIPLHDLEGALKLSESEFESRFGVKKPQRSDENVVLHCLAGVRSSTALVMAEDFGYDKFRHYPGAWGEWYLSEVNP